MTTHLLNLIMAFFQDNLLGEIVNEARKIETNTRGDWFQDGINLIAIFSIVLAIWSLYIAYRSLVYTRLTVKSIQNEADKDRIDNECQKELFRDIIRHLYRNKVCTLAMQAKLIKESWNGYPSDEHFLKLQLLPSDIHLEQYYKDVDRFKMLHNIELLLRNYNTEIEVAQKHISDKGIDEETKKRDFDTLNLKPGLLTARIIAAMNDIWPGNDFRKDAKSIIKDDHRKNIERNDESKGNHWDRSFSLESFPKEDMDLYITDIFSEKEADFKKMLETDVMIECGTNQKGEEKVYIIKY